MPEDLIGRLEDESAGSLRTVTSLAAHHLAREIDLSPDEILAIYRSARRTGDSAAPRARVVRLCVYRAPATFMTSDRITEATSRLTRIGDVQVFAVKSSTAASIGITDAVHSIWKAVSDPRRDPDDLKRFIADFTRVLTLRQPVGRAALVRAQVIRGWPQHHRGLLFDSPAESARLAEALSAINVSQRAEIFAAFGLGSD